MTGTKAFSLPGSRCSTPRPRTSGHGDDFKVEDQLILAIRLSFPLPKSGAFKDLLAIDDADGGCAVGPLQPLE